MTPKIIEVDIRNEKVNAKTPETIEANTVKPMYASKVNFRLAFAKFDCTLLNFERMLFGIRPEIFRNTESKCLFVFQCLR